MMGGWGRIAYCEGSIVLVVVVVCIEMSSDGLKCCQSMRYYGLGCSVIFESCRGCLYCAGQSLIRVCEVWPCSFLEGRQS